MSVLLLTELRTVHRVIDIHKLDIFIMKIIYNIIVEKNSVNILKGSHASHVLFIAVTVQFGFHVPYGEQMLV